ncbi:MAG TPA: retropepsin-like aspartic protease [Gemmatimonadaceae bacterium]
MTTRVLFAAPCAILLLAIPPARASAQGGPLGDLYRARRLFALRDRVAARADRSVETRCYRGIVLEKFNQVDASIAPLRACIAATTDTLLAREAWRTLADGYVKLYRYGEAASAYEGLVRRYGAADTALAADWRNSAVLWRAAARAAMPQRIATRAGTTLPMMRDRAGLLRVPVRVNGESVSLVFDTGAQLSVLSASEARRLGVQVSADTIRVDAATGLRTTAHLGVARRLRLGSIEMREVLFLVFPDSALAFPQIGYRIDGILGFPVLDALGEISLERDARLRIPARVDTAGLRNLALDDLVMLVAGAVDGRRGCYQLDTGASTTALFPSFLAARRGARDARLRARITADTVGVGGAGGVRLIPGLAVSPLVLATGGATVSLPRVHLYTEPIDDASRVLDGTIGQDVLRQFAVVTLNFRAMSFELRAAD